MTMRKMRNVKRHEAVSRDMNMIGAKLSYMEMSFAHLLSKVDTILQRVSSWPISTPPGLTQESAESDNGINIPEASLLSRIERLEQVYILTDFEKLEKAADCMHLMQTVPNTLVQAQAPVPRFANARPKAELDRSSKGPDYPEQVMQHMLEAYSCQQKQNMCFDIFSEADKVETSASGDMDAQSSTFENCKEDKAVQTVLLEKACQVDDNIDQWSSLVRRAVAVNRRKLTRYDWANTVAQEEIDQVVLKGKWVEVENQLPVGDVIQTKTAFLSNDEVPATLTSASVGIVEEVDGDGDALIRFPTRADLRNRARWVVKSKFKELTSRTVLTN